MVHVSTTTVLAALLGLAAAGAHRVPAHAALHQRGEYPTSSPAAQTYATSAAPSVDTTCTEEESTTPVAQSTTTYAVSSPSTSPAQATYPVSSPSAQSTYQASSPSAQSTYAASSPAQSTYAASSPAQSTYAASSPAQSTYAASSPVAESSYEASSPAQSTYAASTPVAESSYQASTPAESSPSYKATTTSYIMVTSVHVVTGGSPTSPAAGGNGGSGGSGSGGAGSGECGTVTVTVTAGQEGHTSKKPKPQTPASTYEVSSPVAQSTYQASSSAAPSTYQASSSAAPSTYAAASPAAPAKTYAASSSKSSSTASSNEGSTTGKRGVAYADIPTLNLGSSHNIAWAHNWSPEEGSTLPSGVEFVPMLKDLSMISQFQAAASGAKYLMAFNEVDMTTGGGGTPMTPEQAASGFMQYLMPFAGNAKLGTPSQTSDDSENSMLNGISAASGLDYLKQFAQACSECQINFAQVHWYGATGQSGEEQAENFKTYIQQAISTVESLFGQGTPIWITEFSALPTIDQDTSGVNQAFMESVLPWLDSQAGVERYSYFAAKPSLLSNADGSLTSIGQTYATS